MLGLEWCFFEAVGESTQAKWHYQPGIGSYRKINSYQHVGVGKGDFVKEDSMFGGEWLPVGKGSGSYIRVQTFQHVGQGQGDYDKEEITSYSEWKLRPCCVWLCLVLLVLLVALLAMIHWRNNLSPQNWEATVQRAVGLGADESYNCDVDFTDWKAAWSNTKKDWCCQNFQRGCHGGYDCNAGFISWKTTWSLNKKEWCCSQRGRGCDSKGTQLYDCDSGYEDWKTKWTQGQKLWCCTVYDRGCPASTASEFQVKYNCKSESPSTWTLQKQKWCCKNGGIGCKEAQYGYAYNCQADLRNVASWRDDKRYYCCKHHEIGCAFNCDAGYDRWEQGWSTQKKRFCCNHHGRGCEPNEPDPKEPKAYSGIDCNSNPDVWSAITKLYCCEHHNKGCQTTATTTLTGCAAACDLKGQKYSCEARINYVARSTFAHQLNACGKAHQEVLSQCDVCSSCSLGQVTCQALPVSKPFDCHAALQNWVARWSSEKKAWCCKHEMKGCGDSFCDNLEELHRWTKSKKAFCCRTKGNGCTGSQPPNLPAGPGYNWRHAKVHGVYTWVRHPVQPKPQSHVQVVHSTPSFDCDDGFSDFVHGWSTAKKHWCCTHKGLACTGPIHPAVPLKLRHQWEKKEINGVWTWTQVRSHVTKTYDCTEGLLDAPLDKLAYCCEHFGRACN